MKKVLIVCCLLLIATSLFAVELKPYKYGWLDWFHMVDENDTVTVLGEPFTSGYISRVDSYILFNLKNSYSELVLTFGVTDNYNTERTSTINFFVDGNKVKSVSVNCYSMPEEITIPLNYKRQLKIETDYYSYADNGSVFLTNLDFH